MSATPLNLNESNEGMTFINQKPPEPQDQAPPAPIEYSAEMSKEEKNNNSNNQETMDSTPLADILPSNEVMDMSPQDPRMVQAQPQMMAQAQPAVQQQAQAPPQPQKTNPLNLTDEQMEALFVGVCAIIAFSRPVQDKLANFIPQFVGDDGARSTTGLAVTGLVAAAVFYFGQRMVLNQGS